MVVKHGMTKVATEVSDHCSLDKYKEKYLAGNELDF